MALSSSMFGASVVQPRSSTWQHLHLGGRTPVERRLGAVHAVCLVQLDHLQNIKGGMAVHVHTTACQCPGSSNTHLWWSAHLDLAPLRHCHCRSREISRSYPEMQWRACGKACCSS